MNNISVILPAYNEEENIGEVIDKVKNSKINSEIIVVDNCSTDRTVEIAQSKGVIVVSCMNKGKGYAMERGLQESKNEIVVFLDADVVDYNDTIIENLVTPIVERNVDFVKSSFNRTTGGKVTQLVTKPLLNILFPEMYEFMEPLSGMIAGKKSILSKLEFEKDYGVDIGILLDLIQMKATIEEVNIGQIHNLSHSCKTIESMQTMATQVMKAILKRQKKTL